MVFLRSIAIARPTSCRPEYRIQSPAEARGFRHDDGWAHGAPFEKLIRNIFNAVSGALWTQELQIPAALEVWLNP